MTKSVFSNKLTESFLGDEKGGVMMQSSLLFGAVAIAAAVFLAPQLDNSSERYAKNASFGIDRIETGSVEKGKTTRRMITKSVLDPK